MVERLLDQRRDLLALMKLLNFGAGSDSTAGLATHGLQQANTQSTVRVDKYGECAYGECFTRTTQQRQLKKEVYIQGQISRVVSHSQRILSQRKHHLLTMGESSSPPEELCSSSEELWTNEVEQLLSEETGPNGHGRRFPRGVLSE